MPTSSAVLPSVTVLPSVYQNRLQTWQLPPSLQQWLDWSDQQGYEQVLVGGCVRDRLLGHPIKDYDLAIAVDPETLLKAVTLAGFKVDQAGFAQGTLGIHVQGDRYEVTSYRIESDYSDQRRPDHVCFTTDLLTDLARRDFTLNAMAYHPKIGLVDPYEGLVDLQNRCLRCVGDPQKRFNEDALRLLRALRFALREGFELEKNTLEAWRKALDGLLTLPGERLQKEWHEILRHWADGRGTGIWPECQKALLTCFPAWRIKNPQGRFVLGSLIPKTPGYLWASLISQLQEPHLAWAHWQARLKPSRALADQVKTLVEWVQPKQLVGSSAGLKRGYAQQRRVAAVTGSNGLKRVRDMQVNRRATQTGFGVKPNATLKAGRARRLRLSCLQTWGSNPDELHAYLRAGLPSLRAVMKLRYKLEKQAVAERWPLEVSSLALRSLEYAHLKGIQPGPQLGEGLKNLLDAIWAQQVTPDRAALIDFVQKM